jgi:TPR repeat protein
MSVPIYDFAKANEEFAHTATEVYFTCCGKTICGGCVDSFAKSGNDDKCPFCNSDRDKTDEEDNEDLMKRVEANDAGAILALGNYYYHGQYGLQQDLAKAMELWKQAAKLGSSKAHYELGVYYDEGGDLKKAKFHFETAAMAGHEVARFNLGNMEDKLGNKERAVKHWIIAASAGSCDAMHALITCLEMDHVGYVSRDAIAPILTAYNNSCVEMQSEARDAYVRTETGYII